MFSSEFCKNIGENKAFAGQESQHFGKINQMPGYGYTEPESEKPSESLFRKINQEPNSEYQVPSSGWLRDEYPEETNGSNSLFGKNNQIPINDRFTIDRKLHLF